MIQRTNATQSRQNFGMALRKTHGFEKEFLKVYGTKPEKARKVVAAIQEVEQEQAKNPIFDLHLIGVGPLGGIKTEIKSKKETYNGDARGLNVAIKIFDIFKPLIPAATSLKIKSATTTDIAKEIATTEAIVGDKLKKN